LLIGPFFPESYSQCGGRWLVVIAQYSPPKTA